MEKQKTGHNRSVYVIAAPYRDWFLRADPLDQHLKNQLVLYRPGFAAKAAGHKPLRGAGRPGSRRGPPPGVTVFANARINKQHHNAASHHECKNTRHRDSAATCTYRRTLCAS